jgi:hypothetical protein
MRLRSHSDSASPREKFPLPIHRNKPEITKPEITDLSFSQTAITSNTIEVPQKHESTFIQDAKPCERKKGKKQLTNIQHDPLPDHNLSSTRFLRHPIISLDPKLLENNDNVLVSEDEPTFSGGTQTRNGQTTSSTQMLSNELQPETHSENSDVTIEVEEVKGSEQNDINMNLKKERGSTFLKFSQF